MSDKQQAVKDALRLVGEGMSANKATQQIAAEQGIAQRTLQRWLTAEGVSLSTVALDTAKNARAVAEADYRLRRARLRVDMLKVAEKVLGRIDVEGEGRQAQAFAVSLGILVDKIRLEEGEPTARTEHLGRDEFMAEVKRLAAEMDDSAHAVAH